MTLHVVPTGDAWHKPRSCLSPPRIVWPWRNWRLQRCAADRRGHPGNRRAAGPTYTVDTLREIAVEDPGAELFLIMGEDQAPP